MFEHVVAMMAEAQPEGEGLPPTISAVLSVHGDVTERIEAEPAKDVPALLPAACICVTHGEHAQRIRASIGSDLGDRLLLDTEELARILLPTESHYDLHALVERLGLTPVYDFSLNRLADAVLDLFSALTGIAF